MSLKFRFAMSLLLTFGSVAVASPPWVSFLPFRKAEPTREKPYELSENDGPWLILAASFSGEGAEGQAQELAEELRRRFRVPAYLHRKRFDFSDTFEGYTHGGRRTTMRYVQDESYNGIAVLVGDFSSINDHDLEKILEKIKFANPECLDLAKRGGSTQRFAGLRELYRKMNGDESKRKKGPMGSAFVTRNPMLPKEYFSQSGPDEFVISLNRGVKYSLLENPGRVTVCVAKFRGDYSVNMSKIADAELNGKVSDKLEVAADQAHRLTKALRKRGVEAYEYHDRHESLVTIGSFDSEGTPLPDGTVDINADILKIMKTYGASKQALPGGAQLGLQPRTLDGVPFDIQPLPIKVPRQSIAGDYVRRGLFR